MLQEWNVVVASSQVHSREVLVSMLQGLAANVITCSGWKQAEEVLSQQKVPLVFCDESLSDGSFRDLLADGKFKKTPRVVVAIQQGEWKEYLEAMRMGAFDAICCPVRLSDVEAVVARAIHEDRACEVDRAS